MTDDKNNLTLCIHCDAEPGQCHHTGHRYHDQPINLQPLHDKNGNATGWIVPPEEKPRWNAPVHKATPPVKPAEQPRPISELITELEAILDVTFALEENIRNTYDHAPLRTTRAVAHIIAATENHRLTNPAGLLITRLREIQTRPTETHR